MPPDAAVLTRSVLRSAYVRTSTPARGTQIRSPASVSQALILSEVEAQRRLTQIAKFDMQRRDTGASRVIGEGHMARFDILSWNEYIEDVSACGQRYLQGTASTPAEFERTKTAALACAW